MTLFRAFLSVILLTLVVYTGIVISNHGMGLLPIFFGDIAQLTWPGQFNLDFSCMLALSALWVTYRHRFGATGFALGACAFFGGALFLSVYLLLVSFRTKGDVASLLLGENREAPGARERAIGSTRYRT